MKLIISRIKYVISAAVILTILVFSVLIWPDMKGHSQTPPSLPPVPVPLVPSILEDIRNTKHNLSAIPPEGIERSVHAVFTAQTTEVCVFCHTPHGATSDVTGGISAPLWNRNLSTASYILYDQVWSTSFEGYEKNPKPNAPTGYSRLCLSCHDGTIALGLVVNRPGSGNEGDLPMIYPTGQLPAGGQGTIPIGSGVSTGDTRVIGTNLQNDHPVSFVYDSSLAMQDEELVDPGPPLFAISSKVGDPTPISPMRRYPGTDTNKFDSVQCTSCHNPHAAKFSDGTTVPKFLRANYFNEPANTDRGKILCLYCHEKPGWSGSAHDIATFKPSPNPTSENAYNFDGVHTVGQYACRACHDPHTSQGAKRLLREGVDVNGNSAIENTCYLCHSPASDMGNPQFPPPDIRSEFRKDTMSPTGGSAMNLAMGQGHEPVFVSRPQEGVELFANLPPPFNEYPPGTTIRDTVHIECVDCHNPHQVTRTNRLKGMKGIDINGNVVGAKIPGNSREPYVHEICLRCHGNSYTNLFPGNTYPDMTDRRSNRLHLAVGDNNLSMKGYSNKRKEFDPLTPDIAADHSRQLSNPAFHPVGASGRNGTQALCNQLAQAFNFTWSYAGLFGSNGNCDTPEQARETLKVTITCTDCHNNDSFEPYPNASTVKGPLTGQPDGTSYRRSTDKSPNINYFTPSISNDPARPQGPHGSKYPRILRNKYNTDIDSPRDFINSGLNPSFYDNFVLCFQCHDRRAFDPFVGNKEFAAGEEQFTNFIGVRGGSFGDSWLGNLHKYHLKYAGAYCHECHYNVHSNVESTNTMYGDGMGGQLPPDEWDGIIDGISGTHLINFAPGVVFGQPAGAKPRWYYDGNKIGCALLCHNADMNTCFYQATTDFNQCTEGYDCNRLNQ